MDRHVFRGRSGLASPWSLLWNLDVGPKRGDGGDAEVRLKFPARVTRPHESVYIPSIIVTLAAVWHVPPKNEGNSIR
jgi:hypothetical protein